MILTRYTGQKGAKQMATIAVDDSENLEKAIKRFKRMVEKEGIIREYKKREFYEKPSTILNRKNKALQRKLMKKTHPRHESKSAYWYAPFAYPKPIPYIPRILQPERTTQIPAFAAGIFLNRDGACRSYGIFLSLTNAYQSIII